MRRKKIYLDTTVISHLRHEDRPDWMAETWELWEILKMGKYDVCISETTMVELMRCPEPKLSELLERLEDIQYTVMKVDCNPDVLALADEMIERGVLPPKCINDSRHIAAAVSHGCNIILSWNFEHFVTERTIDGVRRVCLENHIAPFVDIFSPTVLLERRADR